MLPNSRLLTLRCHSTNQTKLTSFDKTNSQDYYNISADLPLGSGASAYIRAKFNVTTAHITEAGNSNPDQLYISFASAAFIDDQPPMTPEVCQPFLFSKLL